MAILALPFSLLGLILAILSRIPAAIAMFMNGHFKELKETKEDLTFGLLTIKNIFKSEFLLKMYTEKSLLVNNKEIMKIVRNTIIN